MRVTKELLERLKAKKKSMSPSEYIKVEQKLKQSVSMHEVSFRRLKSGPDRARFINEAVDHAIEEAILTLPRSAVSCRKSCAFCCELSVHISRDEAELLMENNVALDLDKLRTQAQTETSEEFAKLPRELRRCVFLSTDNSCQVYDSRPRSCRKHIAVTPAEYCDVESPNLKKAKKIVVDEAEAVLSAANHLKDSADLMARQLLRLMEERK